MTRFKFGPIRLHPFGVVILERKRLERDGTSRGTAFDTDFEGEFSSRKLALFCVYAKMMKPSSISHCGRRIQSVCTRFERMSVCNCRVSNNTRSVSLFRIQHVGNPMSVSTWSKPFSVWTSFTNRSTIASSQFDCHYDQQIRRFAIITGHKRTSKKGKKKKKLARKKVQVKTKKKKYFDPSKTPNYPLGPKGMNDMIASGNDAIDAAEDDPNDATARPPPTPKPVIAPPAMLLPTGSPHVFIAKVACQELNVNPRSLFSTSDMYLRHSAQTRTAYSFEPYGPLFASVKATTGSYENMIDKPEVAFLGRSNVGKSSLINALMNKTLAITSKNPGRTQQAFYYGWIPSQVKATYSRSKNKHQGSSSSNATSIPASAVLGFLVDLPGYGYAVGPYSAVETWQAGTQDFLRQRRDAGTLRRVFILQDARLTKPQLIDGDVTRWLEEENIPHTVILTKADDHHTLNSSGSTAGVVKHANLCSLRYHQLWSESGAVLPDLEEEEEEHDDDDDFDEEEDQEENHDGDHEDSEETHQYRVDEYDDEGSQDEVEEVGTIMLSPIVHVTSAKQHTGLAEILASIETEFVSNPDDE
jgi:GTP-binding protein EngB required for normal cell division